MPAQGEIPPARFRQLSQATAAAVMGVGVSVLIGWWRDIDFLKSVLPGTNSMKINTAVCFILAGLSLWLLQHEGESLILRDWRGRLGQALALMVTVIALLSLSQDFMGWDLGIDQLLVRDPTTIGVPGRIAPQTALAFILLGGALLLLDVRTAKGAWPAQLLAALAGLIGFGGVVGHAYSAGPLLRIGSLTVIAANTSVALLVLCAGILLARPQRGIVRILTREGPGGSLARWLLPAAVLVPFGLGWLRLWGENLGLYGTRLGLALFALANITVMTGLVYRSALVLDRLAGQREEAEEGLKRSEAKFRGLLESAPDAFVIANSQGQIVLVNSQTERLFGFPREEILGQPVEVLIPERFRGRHHEHFENYFVDPHPRPLEMRTGMFGLRKDGSEFPAEISLAPLETEEGLLISSAIRDATQRKQTEQRIQELNRELGHKLEELAAVNQELEGFSYSVAHDLRAPLRHVDGFSKILLEDHGAEMKEEARRLLEQVREGAQHMGTLIDELLNFSRLGRRDLQRQITGLNSLVEEAREKLGTEGDGRSIEWRVGQLPYADCDSALMKQVFANLLSNAVKYTRPREQAVIEVGQIANNGETAIFVRDNGVGFDMKHVGKLFGVFQRLHRSEDFEGTGVGLALVQKIVHKHGGRVWAEAALDRGATFFFTLGAAEAAPQPTGAQTEVRDGR